MGTQLEFAQRGPVARRIASGAGWSIADVICDLGPNDKPSEEQFYRTTIAVVLDGIFECGTRSRKELLYPGSFLLGNGGSCFECGHDHGTGDRCTAFHFDAALFAEIAATAAGSARFRFAQPMLPATSTLARAVVESALSARAEGPMATEELAIALADRVIQTLAKVGRRSLCPLPKERRRLVSALDYLKAHSDELLTLDDLSTVACMSKFHFLRCFRALTGITPHQYLLALRLRRAALKLLTSSAPIASIAFEMGFGDLSTFNNRFRASFGMSPRKLRSTKGLFGALGHSPTVG